MAFFDLHREPVKLLCLRREMYLSTPDRPGEGRGVGWNTVLSYAHINVPYLTFLGSGRSNVYRLTETAVSYIATEGKGEKH